MTGFRGRNQRAEVAIRSKCSPTLFLQRTSDRCLTPAKLLTSFAFTGHVTGEDPQPLSAAEDEVAPCLPGDIHRCTCSFSGVFL